MKKLICVIILVIFTQVCFSQRLIFYKSNVFALHLLKTSKQNFVILFIKKQRNDSGRALAIKIKNYKEYENFIKIFNACYKMFVHYNENDKINVYPPGKDEKAMIINNYSFIFRTNQ